MAYWYNKVNIDRRLLLKSLAVLQIFVAVSNLLTRVGTVDKVCCSTSCNHTPLTCVAPLQLASTASGTMHLVLYTSPRAHWHCTVTVVDVIGIGTTQNAI